MKITQYIGGHNQRVSEFETLEELLEIDWITKWKHDKFHSFHCFSISNKILMVEFYGGEKWWVVGFFDEDPSHLGLHNFPSKEDKCNLPYCNLCNPKEEEKPKKNKLRTLWRHIVG
jgi:hypothetical protein